MSNSDYLNWRQVQHAAHAASNNRTCDSHRLTSGTVIPSSMQKMTKAYLNLTALGGGGGETFFKKKKPQREDNKKIF